MAPVTAEPVTSGGFTNTYQSAGRRVLRKKTTTTTAVTENAGYFDSLVSWLHTGDPYAPTSKAGGRVSVGGATTTKTQEVKNTYTGAGAILEDTYRTDGTKDAYQYDWWTSEDSETTTNGTKTTTQYGWGQPTDTTQTLPQTGKKTQGGTYHGKSFAENNSTLTFEVQVERPAHPDAPTVVHVSHELSRLAGAPGVVAVETPAAGDWDRSISTHLSAAAADQIAPDLHDPTSLWSPTDVVSRLIAAGWIDTAAEFFEDRANFKDQGVENPTAVAAGATIANEIGTGDLVDAVEGKAKYGERLGWLSRSWRGQRGTATAVGSAIATVAGAKQGLRRLLKQTDEFVEATADASRRGGARSEEFAAPHAEIVAPQYKTWNQFQLGTKGQFSSRADAAKAWDAYKQANGITTGVARNAAARKQFLESLADDPNTPAWQRQWLREGRTPPGYEVDHIKPLSIGGEDLPSNMRLQGTDLNRNHHRFHRPWE